jgi:ATP-binding cassette, subfamily B, bacterial
VGIPDSGWLMMSYMRHSAVVRERLTPGTVRRIGGYARARLRELILFTGLTTVDAAVVVASPLLLRAIIDDGIVPRKTMVVTWLAGVAGLALLDTTVSLAQRWYSARIGEGLIYDLRTQVFDHAQRLPVAFFLRIRTGDLISRLNSDIIAAQRALTNTLSGVVSSA